VYVYVYHYRYTYPICRTTHKVGPLQKIRP
jgi:hypothetical protein